MEKEERRETIKDICQVVLLVAFFASMIIFFNSETRHAIFYEFTRPLSVYINELLLFLGGYIVLYATVYFCMYKLYHKEDRKNILRLVISSGATIVGLILITMCSLYMFFQTVQL